MCGISGVELMVILVIAIGVLGPDRLPEVMRMLGRTMREVRKVAGEMSGVRDEFTRTVRDELNATAQTAARRQSAGKEGQDVADIDAIRARKAALEAVAAKRALEAVRESSTARDDSEDDAHATTTHVDEPAENEGTNDDDDAAADAAAAAEHRRMMDDLEKLPLQVRPMALAIAQGVFGPTPRDSQNSDAPAARASTTSEAGGAPESDGSNDRGEP